MNSKNTNYIKKDINFQIQIIMGSRVPLNSEKLSKIVEEWKSGKTGENWQTRRNRKEKAKIAKINYFPLLTDSAAYVTIYAKQGTPILMHIITVAKIKKWTEIEENAIL